MSDEHYQSEFDRHGRTAEVTDNLLDEIEALRSTLAELIRIGDHLHSEASRTAEWVVSQYAPYEVAIAAAEVRSAVAEWVVQRPAAAKSLLDSKGENDGR